jgi:proteasome accessory factor B
VDKLERLLNLTMTLLETPRLLTSADIRDRVPGYPDGDASFKRAFERDKESLREMGIPLTLEEIPFTDPPADGYRIRKDEYYLRDPGFAPDELAALNLAASAVKLDSAHGIEGLWKLGSAVDGPPDGSVGEPSLLAGAATVALPDDPNLGPLFSAVIERRPVQFRYRDAERTVDPYRLDFQRGRWYLTGYDHDRRDERNYRINRIQGAVEPIGTRRFARPTTAGPGGPGQPWQFGGGAPVIARLLVDPVQAPWLSQHLGADAVIEERPDGAIVASMPVTNWPAFRSFVLTFLEHAEILSPPDLVQAMVEWLDEMAS